MRSRRIAFDAKLPIVESGRDPAGKASKALKGTLTCPACHNHLWEVGESGKALDDLQDAARRVKGFGISLEFVVTKADVDAK